MFGEPFEGVEFIVPHGISTDACSELGVRCAVMTYRFSMQDDLSLLENREVGDEMAQDECLETRDGRL